MTTALAPHIHTEAQDTGCRRCRQELAHCHGVVVVHGDGSALCLDDADCSAEVSEHTFVGNCAELFASCGCS